MILSTRSLLITTTGVTMVRKAPGLRRGADIPQVYYAG